MQNSACIVQENCQPWITKNKYDSKFFKYLNFMGGSKTSNWRSNYCKHIPKSVTKGKLLEAVQIVGLISYAMKLRT
jgi:hypothetical protein